MLCGLAVAVFTVPLAAQTATVGGSLVNRESKTPVEGARISIIGTSLGASSDAEGRFQVTGVPAGVRVMQVHAIGFAVGSWVVQLDEGQAFHQTFELAPRALEVEGVTVAGREDDTWRSERGFEERRQRGLGFFVTREQILQRNAPTVAELLRTVPSVMNICNSRGCQTRLPSSKGPCSPEFFLDGYPATFSSGPNFPLSQIRGVEVYRDQFSVPSEFQRPNMTCGVIAIWTVEPGTPLGRH
ncbi:MAG: carboxypeptidase-like regulatory domain-containing protein [Gemmatimonadales bacterium]